MDYTYCGWGQKWRENCIQTPIVLCDQFQTEFLGEPASLTEAKDPTYEDEQLFYTKIKQLEEEIKKKQTAAIHLTVNDDVNEEDEEKILINYNYD